MRTCLKLNFYLNNEILFNNENILKYSLKIWKNIKYKYFIIIIIIKNILLISIFSIGVERIFNITHNIYYYHRNRLNPDTIEMIILMKWYEKLELWIFKKNFNLFNEKKRRINEINKV